MSKGNRKGKEINATLNNLKTFMEEQLKTIESETTAEGKIKFANQAKDEYLSIWGPDMSISMDNAEGRQLKKDVQKLFGKVQEILAENEVFINDRQKRQDKILIAHGKILSDLTEKINQFKNPTDIGKRAAQQLLTYLQMRIENYVDACMLKQNSHPQGFIHCTEVYFGELTRDINNAKKTLKDDLDLGDYLTNMLKALGNAIRAAFGYSGDFFKPKKAESLDHVEEAEEQINKTKNP